MSLRRVHITETDPQYQADLAQHIMGLGARPILFEVPEDFDVEAFEGLAVLQGEPQHAQAPTTNFREQFTEVVAWLEAYQGTFEFYVSLKQQLATQGSLSPKQIEAVKRAIERDVAQGKGKPAVPVQEFSVKPGTAWVLSKFIARKVAEAVPSVRIFRTVEVVEIEAETPKAFRARVKLSAQRTSHCVAGSVGSR